MRSPIVKRSIVIAGHKTSVSLEDAFWEGLKEIVVERHTSLSNLVAAIDSARQHGNLSSAIRLFRARLSSRPKFRRAREAQRTARDARRYGARLFLTALV